MCGYLHSLRGLCAEGQTKGMRLSAISFEHSNGVLDQGLLADDSKQP
jgi:hypothetical protein